MNPPPPFQPQTELSRALVYKFQTGDALRRLQVFRWGDRLVAHEEASGLWWGTLDAQDERNAWEFWHQSVANERIGRLFSQERGAFVESGAASLSMIPFLSHVLVGPDNSGAVLIEGQTAWHSFAPAPVFGLQKPLAHRPTIWSPRFHFRFARRAFKSAYKAAHVARLPQPLAQMWPQGERALPLRLVSAALAFGWGDNLTGMLKLSQFWKAVLQSRLLVLGDAHLELLHSPEVAIPGEISINVYLRYYQKIVTFVWRSPEVVLQIKIGTTLNSAHERLEAGLELREWLSQFFPAREVDAWFKQ